MDFPEVLVGADALIGPLFRSALHPPCRGGRLCPPESLPLGEGGCGAKRSRRMRAWSTQPTANVSFLLPDPHPPRVARHLPRRGRHPLRRGRADEGIGPYRVRGKIEAAGGQGCPSTSPPFATQMPPPLTQGRQAAAAGTGGQGRPPLQPLGRGAPPRPPAATVPPLQRGGLCRKSLRNADKNLVFRGEL